ncbi:LysR family transcriptional regulator [Corallococcus sp. ZKHCc1 1396]|uniref:LysR family transcriptional regulator n=1 Tax=Corallococcus soli TaxID=2710757 RepID=A0ABR9PXZ0_9BACT|nr:LysR family transcriptional regulator [Corallococcus soli]MBE4752801.1 LysR family transcriptional regulator [Corallococcus soli]
MVVQKRSAPLDWEDLRFFVALARAGSLSAAARQLKVSHATVGRRVAALEDTLGRALFDRRVDGYALTAEGAAVLELATGMDERALAILRRAGQESGLTGTVRLTAAETLAERFLIPRLAEFHRRHPGIELEVLSDPRSLSLARREADVAVRLARPQAGELFTRRLAAMTYGVYVAPGGDTSAWVGYDDSFAHLPEAQWLAQHAAGARVALRANGLAAQFAAVRAGFGKAVMPRWFAEEEGGLVEVPPPAPPPVREAWLVVHRDLKDVPRVRALIDAVVAAFEAEQARLGASGP